MYTSVYIYICIYIYIPMENDQFIDDFLIDTSIYKGFSMAMLVITRGYIPWPPHDMTWFSSPSTTSPPEVARCPSAQRPQSLCITRTVGDFLDDLCYPLVNIQHTRNY